MIYQYYAIIEQTGSQDARYDVTFPDFSACNVKGKTILKAIDTAKDTLGFHLLDQENRQADLPTPSAFHDLLEHLNTDQVLQLFVVDSDMYRSRDEKRAVKKMVTIPKWLLQLGKEHHVNFSQVLQEALKKELKVKDRVR